jgi:hypothetical protein
LGDGEPVCGARAWTDKTNGAQGGENFWLTGGGSVLRGVAGRGPGGVGAAWRRSGRERGREGGPGRSMEQGGSGVAAVHP